MKEKILITGGAGYLGSMMVDVFLQDGHEVTVVDNFMYKQASLGHLCKDKNLTIVRGDARIPEVMIPLLKKFDVVIPLAAYVGAPLCARDPIGATSINRDAIYMMLDHISNNQLVIMPTTNSAYGVGEKNNHCNEDSPLKPISHYAREKVEVEKRLMDHPNAISLRLATVFGMSARMRIDLLVNDFVYRAVNDKAIVLFEGHFKRNYIHISDVARAFNHCLNNRDKMCGNIYNVGLSSANVSKAELCEYIKRHITDLTILEAPVGVDPDQRNYIVSNAKIEKTGFLPMTDLDAGITELIKGYQMLRNSRYGNI